MDKKILVETSARHIHLTQENFDYLMGEENGEHASLTEKKALSQPGQYLSTTKLNLIGAVNPKTGKNRTINGVSILGPLRKYNQVEISLTDARTLGITVPVRESGDIEGSAPITIENPVNGKRLELKEGLIAAKRHIHMTPKDAEDFGVKNGDIVSVKISGTGRETTFGDTVIRVSDKFALAMHIDTDESNAACASGVIYGELIK